MMPPNFSPNDLLSSHFAARLMKKHPQIVEMIRLSLEGGMTVEQIKQATANCGSVPLHLAIIYTAQQLAK